MSKYIKSHSNFVAKSKHQNLDYSTIWERDITTIGGVDQYAQGQTPIYRSGNFIITVRNDGTYARDIAQTKWAHNSSSGETWTQSAIDAITNEEALADEDDLLIKPKQDYYELRDFAYYGSCAELIRGSINGIIQNFPGELYCDGSGKGASYYSGSTLTSFDVEPGCTYVNNPFFIDLHSKNIGDVENVQPLRYFCNSGYTQYEIIYGDAQTGTDVTTWTSTYVSGKCPGEQIAEITINGNIRLLAYLSNNGAVCYFAKSSQKFHIRPKYKHFVSFYNNLSTFQKLLLNVDSSPKYKATFRIITENDYGYYTKMESFEFPKDSGGYNISTSEEAYSSYIQRLAKIGTYYDEHFSDNLWRSMTHEAIKNFDWSYKREYADGDDEEYTTGGNKIQKMIRLYGREFDECKTYIDSIQNTTKLTYDERSNLPDYFLTDLVNGDGWDFHPIYPLSRTTSGYSQVVDVTVKPYQDKHNGFGYTPSGCTDTICNPTWSSGGTIRPYSSEKEYTYKKGNTEFLKRLKLNSRGILRHKGTIEGIEMMLAMFGLKSKRWFERQNLVCMSNNTYDYDIKEYTTFITKPIEERWDKLHNEYRIDWVNSTKLIDYNYSDKGITYVKYQGLPVSYRDLVGNTNTIQIDGKAVTDFDGKLVQKRYLYPYFDSSEQLDGNPYYQMNGGWESKKFKGINFQFDRNDNFVSAATHALYHETIRDIKCADDLSKLLQVVDDELHDGSVYYVRNLNDLVCSIEGELYDIETDEYTSSACTGYVELTVTDSSVYLSDLVFDDVITVYDNAGSAKTYNLDSYEDGYVIKGYIWQDENHALQFMAQSDSDVSISSFNVFSYMPNSGYTHYFYLNDVNYKDKLAINSSDNGWRELRDSDDEYKEANLSYDYLEGNNPHTGNYHYDDGYDYLYYLEHLMKYSLDNDLFDERCYGNDYEYTMTQEIPGDGYTFSGLTNGNSINKIEDEKIHFFGNYWTYKTNNKLNVYSDDKDKWNGSTYSQLVKDMYPSSTSVSAYTIRNVFSDYDSDDQTIDQIVNTKHVKITFYIPSESTEGITQNEIGLLKYYDSVIIPYLEQMIPSTIILEVNYKRYNSSDEYSTITWKDNNNEIIKSVIMQNGEIIDGAVPDDPHHTDETFIGWN